MAGDAQHLTPLSVDDVRIYNYALSAEEITHLAGGAHVGINATPHAATATTPSPIYNINGTPAAPSTIRPHQIYVRQGKKALTN